MGRGKSSLSQTSRFCAPVPINTRQCIYNTNKSEGVRIYLDTRYLCFVFLTVLSVLNLSTLYRSQFFSGGSQRGTKRSGEKGVQLRGRSWKPPFSQF